MIGRKSMMGLMHLKPEGRWAGPRASQVTAQVTAKIPSVTLASDHTWEGGAWGGADKGLSHLNLLMHAETDTHSHATMLF